VGYEENRDAVMLIPLAQIGDQKGLGGAVECGQRFIEQQGTRFGDESAG